MSCPAGRTVGFLALLVVFALIGVGCGGGDGEGLAAIGLSATITGVDTVTYASLGVVVVSYEVTGIPNTLFDLVAEYALLGGFGFSAATPVPPALVGAPSSTPLLGLSVPSVDVPPPVQFGTLSGVFVWYAGADLGFLPAQFLFSITPVSPTSGQPNGAAGTAGPFTYSGGQPPQASTPVGGPSASGAGSGSPGNPGSMGGGSGAPVVGRAGQTATSVRNTAGPGPLKTLLLAGGYNDAPPTNAFDGADRFNVNTNLFTHNIVPVTNPLPPQPRVLHASSFFLDPGSYAIKVLVTGGVTDCRPGAFSLSDPLGSRVGGGTDTATAFFFSSPTNQLVATMNMGVARYGHTATWVPSNEVVIIGGAQGTTSPVLIPGMNSIEHYNPLTNSFTPAPGGGGLMTPRVEHSATLLADGSILVCGGYNPASPGTSLPSEIYDPKTGISTSLPPPFLERFGHTATRLANGWVIVAGGRSLASGSILGDARLFRPENGVFDAGSLPMASARALHSATLLGNRQVLLAGGVITSGGSITNSTEVFRVPDCFTTTVPVAFSSVNAMLEPRAEHSAAAVEDGSVFIIGGRNTVGSPSGLNFLDSIEFYAFSNSVPVISTFTQSASSPVPATVAINMTVTDADTEGGYVVIRFRTTPGSGPWQHATITAQMPSSVAIPPNFPNHEVCPGPYTFVWDFAADGVGNNQLVEIQIIPFGAVIGTPVQFNARTP